LEGEVFAFATLVINRLAVNFNGILSCKHWVWNFGLKMKTNYSGIIVMAIGCCG